MSLISFFDRGARRWWDRNCLVAVDRAFTFGDVKNRSIGVAGGLRREGHRPGAKCAVLSHNDPVAFICTLGILRAGCVWVPLNPRNAPQENAWLLEAFDCEVLFFQSAFAAEVAGLRERLPSLRTAVCIDAETEGSASLDDWTSSEGDAEFEVPAPESPAMIVPTGGTTGRPKGVVLSNRNVGTFCANVLASLHFDVPPVCLACAPLTHAAGIFAFPMMAIGGTHVVHAAVDPTSILQEIERSRVNFLFLPPTVIYALLAQPEVGRFDFSSLRYLLYGASPIAPAKLREAIEVFGPVMAQMFGQSEAPASITYLSPSDHLDANGEIDERRLKSCGSPTPFVQTGIIDDHGRLLLQPGEIGEIAVRGDLVMTGYYKDTAATEASRSNGWHLTGDLGYSDEQGFLYIVDRKKDLIITGGMNVFATEVEQVVMQYPGVQECAVIGVPDERWGEAVTAFVEPKRGVSIDPDELRAHCRSRLGGVKAPKSVLIVAELPRSGVGKVLKRRLREEAWAGRERSV